MNSTNADQQISMLAHALRSVSECVVVTDMQDTILFVNEAFQETYGYSEEELLGKDIDIIRSKNNPEEVTSQILPTTLKEGRWKGEVLNKRRGGGEFPISLSTSVVRNEKHEPIALIGVSVDITERKHAERRLMEALEAAEAAAKAKSDFLATMSHEIRTPMNGVIGMTELLQHTELNAKQREFVVTIQTCGENLLTIIDDILYFSKLDSGRIELDPQPTDSRKAVREVVALLSPRVEAKLLKLSFVVDEEVPPLVLMDVTRFKQILINLVGNGIKFTEFGEVFVHLSWGKALPEGFELRCAVKDTGLGIPANKLDRLFKAFSQVDTSISRRFGGTGLGLAISTGLVQLMGGQIGVNSGAGMGSTFTFTIPAEAVKVAQVEEQPVYRVDRNLAARIPLRILVAEDNPVNRRLILHVLNQFGYAAEVAEDGNQAVDAVTQNTFDLVFLDVHMPELDGLQAARRINELLPNGRPRLIAVTADAMVGDREKCLDAGMDDYIRKPIRSEDLQRTIERWGVLGTGETR